MSRTLSTAMLMATALSACMSPPLNLDTSLNHPSAQGRYLVQLEPPPAQPAINQIHSWQIKLAAPDGTPVRQARIAVDGGMPQHGHGLPTRPVVSRELSDGTYLLEGMKFSMTGWWEIKLAIDASPGADKVVFNTVVTQPGASR